MDSQEGKPLSQTFQFQANSEPNVQANSSEGSAQAVRSATPSQHVKFEAGPTPTHRPPSQPFTFQAGPTLAYPKPAIVSDPSPTQAPPQPDPTYASYDQDFKKLHRLESEVEDLQKRYCDVQHDVGLLTKQHEHDQGRLFRRHPPPAPPADRKADQRRLRREDDYKRAVAEKAHNDAKRVEVEVKRQVRCDDIAEKRKNGWDKNKQHASPVHRFLITPATAAEPVTSFTTALAYRTNPSSSAPALASASHHSSSPLPVTTLVPPAPSPSKVPLPNRSRLCSQSAEPDAVDCPVCSCSSPALKGILIHREGGRTREAHTPAKILRFSNLVKVARIVDELDDGDGDGDDGSSGVDGRRGGEQT